MSSIMSVEEIINLIEYQGFNPEKVMRELARIEPDEETRKADMKILVLLIAIRGTKGSKSTQKMTSEGAKMINDLLDKYSITDRKPEGASTITLSRISACYAMQVSKRIKKGQGRVVGKVPRHLPECYCFPAGGSLLPRSNEEAIASWKKWRRSFSAVINGKAKREDAGFDDIVINSRCYSDEEREAYAIENGLDISSDASDSEEEGY